MDYKRVYNQIIENRKLNPLTEGEYGERHHILPKSLGGSDEPNNLVKLTAREHFICHALLAEIYEDGTNEWYKMNHAFMMMKSESMFHDGNRYFNSRLYEFKRKDFSKTQSWAQSGQKNSQYGTQFIYNTKTGERERVKKSEPIPNGWVVSKNRYKKTTDEVTQERVNKGLRKANKLFDEFINSEYSSVSQWVSSGSVPHSQQYLSKLWLKYIPDRYKTDSKTQTIKNAKKLEKNKQRLKEDRDRFTVNGIYFRPKTRKTIYTYFNINFEDGDVVEKYNKLYNLLYNLYHIKKLSTPKIADMFNTTYGTINYYMGLFGVDIRTKSESVKLSYKTPL